MSHKDQSQPLPNRREFTRVPFHVETQLITNQQTYTVEKIRDLSLGGCFLPTSVPAPWVKDTDVDVGKPCRVSITLAGTSNGLNVEIGGTILRVNEGGIAVRFTTIAPESLYHLQNIIRYNAVDADSVERELQARLSQERNGSHNSPKR